MHVIRHEMTFLDVALPAALGNEHHRYLQSNLVAYATVVVHRETSSRVRGGSRVGEASPMDDCRKRQTATATPAEPGDLPW